MIRGGLKPVTGMRRLPMLPYIVTTQDGFIPAEVNDVCRKLAAQPGVIDCSWFHGFPYADIAAPARRSCAPPPETPRLRSVASTKSRNGSGRIARRSVRRLRPPHRASPLPCRRQRGLSLSTSTQTTRGGGTPGDGTHLLLAGCGAAMQSCLIGGSIGNP